MPNFSNTPAAGVLSLRPGDTVFVFGIPTNAALSASPAGAVRNLNVVTFTTGAAHNFVPGMSLTALGIGSVGGTRFYGNYVILAVPSTTTLTAQPIDQGGSGSGNMNQPNDTGGGGNIKSIAAEAPAAPQASIAIALADTDAHINDNLAIEIFFTAAPGAFEVDLQEADTYNDAAFTFVSGGSNKITAVIAATNVGRLDIDGVIARFVRLNLVSRANAGVGIVARLSR
jgi:hypothetical protein